MMRWKFHLPLAGLLIGLTGLAFAQPAESPEPSNSDEPAQAEPVLPLTGEIYDIHQPQAVPRFTTQDIILMVGGASLGIGLTLALIIWLIRRRRPRDQEVSPYYEARLALREASEFKHIESVKQYSSALSDAVRVYIEKAFDLPAPERTTEEFLPEIQAHPIFRGELSDRLKDFLSLCDLAKFARQQMDGDGLAQLQLYAEEIVDKAHLQRMQMEARESDSSTPPASQAPRLEKEVAV